MVAICCCVGNDDSDNEPDRLLLQIQTVVCRRPNKDASSIFYLLRPNHFKLSGFLFFENEWLRFL